MKTIIGASTRFLALKAGTLTEEAGCQHKRVLYGGGAHFGDDLCTCVDCGLEKYEESFPATAQTVLKKREVNPVKGVYDPVTPEQYESARPMMKNEAPLFGAVS